MSDLAAHSGCHGVMVLSGSHAHQTSDVFRIQSKQFYTGVVQLSKKEQTRAFKDPKRLLNSDFYNLVIFLDEVFTAWKFPFPIFSF